jgi:hypothetical protein
MVTDKSVMAMKKIITNITLLLGVMSLLVFNSCEEKITPVVDELNFNRAFSPVGLTAQISNVTTVTLSWSAVKNTDHYVLEIYEGTDFVAGALIFTTEIEADKITY